jgi:uncharacterized protein (DUF2384 family)
MLGKGGVSMALAHATDSESAKIALAFKAFVAMADLLGLTWDQRCLLLGVPRTTYHRWVTNGVGTTDRDKRDRLAYLLAIYHYAGTAFPGGGGAKGWLTRPNTHPTFEGIRPLDRMLKGGLEDLLAVHHVARAAEALWS